ncbi:MAG TPA: glycosyltransferase [Thermoleophilaceae bacterium]|jgi:glycosyltransferase involved in cell wall biosynthesis
MPGISVVMPVYDGERFIAEAIESVLAQSRPAAEMIVIDDGSTDGSAAVVERFPQVKLIRTENRGPAAARNTGVAEATGELITFLDADDLMKPDRLERQAAALEEDPSASFALGRGEVILEAGVEPPTWVPEERQWYAHMTLFTTRRAFELIGPFDEDLRVGEDTDWLFRAFEAGLRPALVPEPVIVRRYHGGNISQDALARRDAGFKLLRRRVARKRGKGSQRSAVPESVILGVPELSSHDDDR